MKAWLKPGQSFALALAAAVVLGACDEQLSSGMACPALCPQPEGRLSDTTIFAVALDTSVTGFPGIGSELRLFVASLGDTLQTRAVIRYDSLPKTFRHNNTVVDSNIVVVDTGAALTLKIVTGDTLGSVVTVEAYDVDMNGADDSDPAASAGGFTAARLLGTRTVAPAALRDSIRVPIDPAKLLTKIQADTPANRIRIGIRVTSGSQPLRILSSNFGQSATLSFRPAPGDTSVPVVTMTPRSISPSEPLIDADLADYLLVVQAPAEPPADVIRIGGLPGRRAYLRFDIPSHILDSSNVVRASLILTQRPNASAPSPNDTVTIRQFAAVASSAVADLSRALLFLSNTRPGRTDSVRLISAGSGVRNLEMIGLVRAWRSTSAQRTPRAMALMSASEGDLPLQVEFFSTEAPIDVRPRLRLTYLPRQQGGLP